MVRQSFRDPLPRRVVNKLLTKFRATPFGLAVYAHTSRNEPQFTCPACGYHGALVTLRTVYGERKHAQCPKCGALERHRLMALVMREIDMFSTLGGKDVLHFAPEPFFALQFKMQARSYRTSDLVMRNVDMRVDLADIPVADDSVDVLIASYILQYVPDDRRALREIFRVLRPGGVAILPVTVVSDQTIEYPEPNPYESGGHIRAPGSDYFDRMRSIFSRVDLFRSEDYPEIHQTYVYEDREKWPTREMPLWMPMRGHRHAEYIPVCWK